MAYDSTRGQTVLYGSRNSVYLGDSWQWNGATGSPVTLNGSGSFDPGGDPVTYTWAVASQPLGSSISLSGPATARPAFTPLVPGAYTFTLSLTNSRGLTSTASVTITATSSSGSNQAPLASAGPTVQVSLGSTVSLDGSASADPDHDTLDYSWSIVSQPSASALLPGSLTGANGPIVSFVPATSGSFVLKLSVDDGRGGLDSANLTVAVKPVPPEDYAQSIDQAIVPIQAGVDRLGVLGTAAVDKGSASMVATVEGEAEPPSSVTSANRYRLGRLSVKTGTTNVV